MHRQVAILIAGVTVLGMPQLSSAAPPTGLGAAQGNRSERPLGPKALRHKLNHDLHTIQGLKGAYVVDLTTGQVLYAKHPATRRMPASVEKLYTTTTALLRLGPSAVLSTSVLGSGQLDSTGTWHGTLYLRGGGDPSFGSQSFDHAAYGTGATIGKLARAVRDAGITRLSGQIVGDESRFDSLRGTAATNFKRSFFLEGQLSALAYDRGFSNSTWTAFQHNPPKYAATRFAAALRSAGVRLPSHVRIRTGMTPRTAQPLAAINSPKLSKLIKLTNTPSDNFFAETLLKDLGASFGGGGTTAAGVGVVHRELRNHFHIDPRFNDGSGLSRYDATSPKQVVTLLRHMNGNSDFVHSLAIAGETGTLQDEMRGTRAQGNCRGKTGTLYDVASLVGYCTARNGDTLTFAYLLNGLANSTYGHTVEANMAVALANYKG